MPLPIASSGTQAAAVIRVSTCSKRTQLRHAARCLAVRQSRRGGSGGGRRHQGQRESVGVEIFNIDNGCNVKTLEGVAGLLDADADSDGWSVEAADIVDGGGMSDAGWSVTTAASAAPVESSGDDEEEDLLEAIYSSRRADMQPAVFNGRVLCKAEEQLLASLPRHVLSRLEGEQREADEERAKLTPAARKKAVAQLRTHQQLRIISGTAAGRRLRSPQGDQTRPMMEMVRNAVFNMVMSLYGCSSTLPEKTRWLDLFAGTGAVGIEALSRGVGQCHFVEMSSWVVSKCLVPNLEVCEVESAAEVHTGKAEDFLRRAQQLSQFAGGPFDFMSVCPPYELVDYEEIFDLLHDSPLLHKESIVIVEYPKKLASLIRERLGSLEKLRDRRYGRTYLAIYGPADGHEA